jgi:hypothetical protein
MKCPNCGSDKFDVIPPAERNLETYNPGGQILAASSCCNSGILVNMHISFTYRKYTGDKTEDAWGNKFKI